MTNWKQKYWNGETVIMAIVNVTPDSFSDGGQFDSVQHIVDYCGKCLENGVDVLDVGGESTRPGALEVSVNEEIDRVVPAITAIKKAFPGAYISIDTRKSPVAKEAIKVGASMVNDVSGGTFDAEMDDLIVHTGVDYCIMHSQGTPEKMQDNPQYVKGVVEEIKAFFALRIKVLIQKGLKQENIIIDPGFGFGKTLEQNWEIFGRMDEFLEFNVPVLAGISRKTFLTQGQSIPASERDGLTKEATLKLLVQGIRFHRLHNSSLF